MASLRVFDEKNLKGHEQEIWEDEKDLRNVKGRGFGGFGNWNDEIKSFRVDSGVWTFHEHIDFFGESTAQFGPGTFGNCPDFGFPERWASSIKKVSD